MMTANEFSDWLSTAKMGDNVVYYFGDGFGNRHNSIGWAVAQPARSNEFVTAINKIRSEYNHGRITLLQRRVMGGFEYLAVRINGKPTANGLPYVEYAA